MKIDISSVEQPAGFHDKIIDLLKTNSLYDDPSKTYLLKKTAVILIVNKIGLLHKCLQHIRLHCHSADKWGNYDQDHNPCCDYEAYPTPCHRHQGRAVDVVEWELS